MYKVIVILGVTEFLNIVLLPVLHNKASQKSQLGPKPPNLKTMGRSSYYDIRFTLHIYKLQCSFSVMLFRMIEEMLHIEKDSENWQQRV